MKVKNKLNRPRFRKTNHHLFGFEKFHTNKWHWYMANQCSAVPLIWKKLTE